MADEGDKLVPGLVRQIALSRLQKVGKDFNRAQVNEIFAAMGSRDEFRPTHKSFRASPRDAFHTTSYTPHIGHASLMCGVKAPEINSANGSLLFPLTIRPCYFSILHNQFLC